MAPSSGLTSGLADTGFHRFATRDVDWEAVRQRLEVYPEEQRLTMYLLGAFTGVVAIISLLTPIQVRLMLAPWVLMETLFHEFGHAITYMLSGKRAKVAITEDGAGVTFASRAPGRFADFFITSAGYLTAGVAGAGLVLAGFSIIASKIAHFAIVFICVLPFFFAVRDRVLIPVVLFAILIPVPFWFLEHARYLRFYMLFVGTAVSISNLSFLVATQVLRPGPKSDAMDMQKARFGPARMWGIIWLLLCAMFLAAGILGGIALFHQTKEQQIRAAKILLPT